MGKRNSSVSAYLSAGSGNDKVVVELALKREPSWVDGHTYRLDMHLYSTDEDLFERALRETQIHRNFHSIEVHGRTDAPLSKMLLIKVKTGASADPKAYAYQLCEEILNMVRLTVSPLVDDLAAQKQHHVVVKTSSSNTESRGYVNRH